MSCQVSPARSYASRLNWLSRYPRIRGVIVGVLASAILSACSSGDPMPPELCTAYGDSLYTFQLAGGVLIVLGIALMAFKKTLSSFLPNQGAQVGTIASAIAAGVLLLTFSSDWGSRILTIFALPDMFTLCGLG